MESILELFKLFAIGVVAGMIYVSIVIKNKKKLEKDKDKFK